MTELFYIHFLPTKSFNSDVYPGLAVLPPRRKYATVSSLKSKSKDLARAGSPQEGELTLNHAKETGGVTSPLLRCRVPFLPPSTAQSLQEDLQLCAPF